jgi:hypothetical protein
MIFVLFSTQYCYYSYLNASIGFWREAFKAGYIPAIMPTTIQMIKAIIIHVHGMKNTPPTNAATALPIMIPNMTPITPPSWQMAIASIKN